MALVTPPLNSDEDKVQYAYGLLEKLSSENVPELFRYDICIDGAQEILDVLNGINGGLETTVYSIKARALYERARVQIVKGNNKNAMEDFNLSINQYNLVVLELGPEISNTFGEFGELDFDEDASALLWADSLLGIGKCVIDLHPLIFSTCPLDNRNCIPCFDGCRKHF